MKSKYQSWSVNFTDFFFFFSFFLLIVMFLSICTQVFTNKNGVILASESYSSNSQTNTSTSSSSSTTENPAADLCRGRYIYVYDLPAKFNTDILNDCKSLNSWVDMCPFLDNHGLGPPVNSPRGPGWFATDQYVLELIFHNRMKQYKCLTEDSSLASLIYVPIYVGLDLGRHLFEKNDTAKDELSLELVKWLTEKPQWRIRSGHDHFMVVGRNSWDFVRQTKGGWGSQLLLLPQVKNMTILNIEAIVWETNNNVVSVPYPSYFHPSTEAELSRWQNKTRYLYRPFLFAFVGGPRPDQDSSIRGHIITQCRSTMACQLLDCSKVYCGDVITVMETFESSKFCLQPPGDSPTRRSTFDSILAGCIPVFFHQSSAYLQYKWHFPTTRNYSVFIPEEDIREGKADIEQVLSNIPEEQVVAMREEVLRLIPRVTYAYSELETIEDAFDIAIDGLLNKVNHLYN